MAGSSTLDRLEQALRAGQVSHDSLTDAQRTKVDAWITQNPERYVAIQSAGTNLVRETIAQLIQRESHREAAVQNITRRLQENPELRAKVVSRISENAHHLLTPDRKERLFRVFGVQLDKMQESLRQRV